MHVDYRMPVANLLMDRARKWRAGEQWCRNAIAMHNLDGCSLRLPAHSLRRIGAAGRKCGMEYLRLKRDAIDLVLDVDRAS